MDTVSLVRICDQEFGLTFHCVCLASASLPCSPKEVLKLSKPRLALYELEMIARSSSRMAVDSSCILKKTYRML